MEPFNGTFLYGLENGPDAVNQQGQYSGIQDGTWWFPGGRTGAMATSTKDGTFWLFGGFGYASPSPGTIKIEVTGSGYIADMWNFNPSITQW